jgi:hypothetical protein
METKWNKLPRHAFSCRGFIKPADICYEFKKRLIDKYVYEIKHDNITIKFGMSDDKQPMPGSRVYRQVGKLYSWKNRLLGPNDETFEAIDDEYNRLYGHRMDHNQVSIVVWDFTHYPYQSFSPKFEIYKAEQELIEVYAKYNNGQKPFGNYYDMDAYKNKYLPHNNLFEIE